MRPVTHPKVLRSPNQIRNTLSAPYQICLWASPCEHAVAATCLYVYTNSGENKRYGYSAEF